MPNVLFTFWRSRLWLIWADIIEINQSECRPLLSPNIRLWIFRGLTVTHLWHRSDPLVAWFVIHLCLCTYERQSRSNNPYFFPRILVTLTRQNFAHVLRIVACCRGIWQCTHTKLAPQTPARDRLTRNALRRATSLPHFSLLLVCADGATTLSLYFILGSGVNCCYISLR